MDDLSVTQLVEKIEAMPATLRPRDRAILEMATERLGTLEHEKTELEDRIDRIGKTPTELVTVYPHGIKTKVPDAPLPRLQFRWAKDSREESWLCYYEFCWQLKPEDIRNEWGHGVARTILGCTRVGSFECPWKGRLAAATPFRDGAHASWDASAFGNPPVYVVDPDGNCALREERK